jgi:hypothetical protein
VFRKLVGMRRVRARVAPSGPVSLVIGLIIGLVAGCGWSPPSAQPPPPDTCTPTDGPAPDTVAAAIDQLPRVDGQPWRETARGHTHNCRLYWVQVMPITGQDRDTPQQVLFFDRNSPIGTATPDPRPYLLVLNSGPETVTVQYQWRQGDDEPCCPTGIGTVRFQIDDDGRLRALDPIPGP